MTDSNKLIILRDRAKFSQQDVADALSVSKSTYCRYERGDTQLGINELDAILKLYSISYEDFSGIHFPIKKTISYPKKLLENLRDALIDGQEISDSYSANKQKYYRIKDALEPLLLINQEALDFPDLDISHIQPGTTLKEVVLDVRGEKLIQEAFIIQTNLFSAMESQLYSKNNISQSKPPA